MSDAKVIADPGKFNGDRKAFDSWWKRVKVYLAYQKGLKADQKILAVLSRMIEGPGAHWASNEIERILNLESDADREKLNFLEFTQRITERFSNTGGTAQAKAKLHSLKQYGKPVDEFLDEFEETRTISGIGEESAIFLLECNMNKKISEIMYASNATIPTVFAEYVTMVRTIGHNIEGHREAIRMNGGGWNSNKPRDTTPKYIPMEVDKVEARKCYNCQKPGHLAKDCRSAKKERGDITCYNCNTKGHMAKDCRKPKKKGSKVRVVDEEDDDTGSKIEDEEDDNEGQGFAEGSD